MRVKFAYKITFTHPDTGEQAQGWTTQTIDSNETPVYLEFTEEEKRKLISNIVSQITKFDDLFIVPNGIEQSAINLFLPTKQETTEEIKPQEPPMEE